MNLLALNLLANGYYNIAGQGKQSCLSRFLNVDGVGAVRMSRGKLFHEVRPATENIMKQPLPAVRSIEPVIHSFRRKSFNVHLFQFL